MGKKFIAWVMWVVWIFIALNAEVGGCASFEERDFDALARESDQIAIGTVGSINSRRTGVREIVTDYRFDNLEIIKGTVPTASLMLTMLGGTVGSDTLSVAGAPTFQRGVRYIVFVSGNGSVMFPLVGGPQGIFQVRTDKASGVSRIHDYAGRSVTRSVTKLQGRASKAVVEEMSSEAAEAITKNVFVDAIRARLSAGISR